MKKIILSMLSFGVIAGTQGFSAEEPKQNQPASAQASSQDQNPKKEVEYPGKGKKSWTERECPNPYKKRVG
jgi:hypothetical protein